MIYNRNKLLHSLINKFSSMIIIPVFFKLNSKIVYKMTHEFPEWMDHLYQRIELMLDKIHVFEHPDHGKVYAIGPSQGVWNFCEKLTKSACAQRS